MQKKSVQIKTEEDLFENLTFEEMQQNIAGYIKQMGEEIRNSIGVDVLPKKVVEKREEPPVFHHKQIQWLYEYNFDIPEELIDVIKSLPVETLTEDLNAVLYDAIARIHIFEQLSWDTDSQRLCFPIHAMLLMRDLKLTNSLESILDFISQSEDFLEFWLSDFLTEDLWSILMVCGMNHPERLVQFMKEPGRYTYSRSAVSDALEQMAMHELLAREQVVNYFSEIIRYYIDNRDIENLIDSSLNGLLVCNCLNIQAVETLPLIQQLYDKRMAKINMAGPYRDVEKEMMAPRFPRTKRTLETMFETFKAYKRITEDEEDLDDLDEFADYISSNPPRTITRSEPKIGRNDPCHCGSGKKYKKCHGKE